ncbi:hypothetical protein M2132_000206 [Dysgonomonas sp. PH5-45]|uniref:hypothetical protein n=1 Tax=unclassified Dysgonomonas TaxID=2630389 RepID=UPI0024769D97|nr:MULTISPECIES: hypothetical protein [unclassified Dysgonomonas]MDH6353886.1 hypothetical protein [Dysgonomonas sp. PH5-45]MDH6386788.1 hypothetical protein [Dysgonomonas sp. PH5-37]
MANSVSNDALWEKLLEISEQLKGSKQAENTPDFSEIVEAIHAFRQSNNACFEENKKNISIVNKNILLGLKRVASIQERVVSHEEEDKSDKASYFDLKFFKLRKTSVVIALLGLLVLALILFCMKQQNDYALLNGEYYRNRIEIREMQSKVDSLQNVISKPIVKKK